MQMKESMEILEKVVVQTDEQGLHNILKMKIHQLNGMLDFVNA